MGLFEGKSKTASASIPAWMGAAGQDVFQAGKQQASRPYPVYDAARIAPFTSQQQGAFDLTGSNVGMWQPSFQQAFAAAGRGMQPVGDEDISRYMNPYTGRVIDSTVDYMNRQFGRDRINRHASMANRGSYLNEDRREIIDLAAEEAQNRAVGDAVARLQAGAFSDALQQANAQRGREFQGASMFGNLAPTMQRLGAGDVSSLLSSGGLQQAQDQQNLTLRYEDFLRQFQYPQEQANWLMSLLSGTPYQTQQLVGQPNPFAQGIGALSAIAGIGGPSGFGWWG